MWIPRNSANINKICWFWLNFYSLRYTDGASCHHAVNSPECSEADVSQRQPRLLTN